jgi:hypothetical protein
MKTGEAFKASLSDRAVDVIEEARRCAPKEPNGDNFVFLGAVQNRTQAGARKPLSQMSLAMMLRRLNPDVSLHGFPTSFRTWAPEVAKVELEGKRIRQAKTVMDDRWCSAPCSTPQAPLSAIPPRCATSTIASLTTTIDPERSPSP